MNTFIINEELKGIEIKFDSKPEADILATLKSNGFRWHKVKKIWYAKQTADRLNLAKSLISGEKITIESNTGIQDKTDQKALKAAYMDIICKDVWKDKKMQDYINKDITYIVPLANGDLYGIEKPSIETSFCFGYGYCGVSTEEDYQGAADMANHAKTDQDYFIKENLKGIDEKLTDLKGNDYYFYKYISYSNLKSGSHLKNISRVRFGNTPENNPSRWSHLKDVEEVTPEEKEALITGYETVKAQFVKRLNTYLKRYGLTKIHSWTYLSD